MSMLTESVDGVIGVDTHRDTLAAAAVTAIGATLGNTEAPANADGYRSLLLFARHHLPNQRCWAVEGTSCYGAGLTEFLTGLGIGRYGVLALIMLMYLVLGCLMDAMAMIILTVPIIFPVIVALGSDPIWFGVIIVMTVELGLIHPPVGMNVFVIKSVVRDVSFTTIFKGVLPFVATDIVRLVILIAFPIIALYLPTRM